MFDPTDCTKDVVPEKAMTTSHLFCNECFRKFPEDQVHVRYERDSGPSGTAGGRGPSTISILSCPKCRSEWLSDWKPALCAQCGDEEVDDPADICGFCIDENTERARDAEQEAS